MKDYKGFAISSFVLSLVAILVAAIICGPLAIIFGAIARQSKDKGIKGLATAGMAIGIVDTVIMIICYASL